MPKLQPMRLISFVISLGLMAASCTNTQSDSEAQKAKQDSLLQAQQDSLLSLFKSELEEISKRVNDVSIRNGLFFKDSLEGNVLSKQSIIDNVESLDQLLSSNQEKLNDINERMRKNNIKNSELEKLISSMQNRINERESEIAKLMKMLEDKDVLIEEIKLSLDSMRKNTINLTEDMIAMDEELHVVYYVIGESKELKDRGIITKDGGLLGIGGSKKLDVSQLNASEFTEVDQRDLESVPLYSKKANLITNHPENSYEFIMADDGTIETLKITDRKRFWAATDYLVVEVSN